MFLSTVKNRHHAALFIQNGYLKLLLRKGPSNDKTIYSSEWIWKLSQINDNQWHSYELIVDYPNKVNRISCFFLFSISFMID